jgi:hypothetical protein
MFLDDGSRRFTGSAPEPARPVAFRERGVSHPGWWTRARRSPPMPHVSGATTPCVAVAAIAASTALPPDRRTDTADPVERKCGVATAPFRAS